MKRIVLVVSTLAALAISVAVPVTAQTSSATDEAEQPEPVDEDVESVADWLNISEDEATERLVLTDAINDYYERLLATEPDLAGFWVDQFDGGVVHVAMVPGAETSRQELTESFERPDLVEVVELPLRLTALKDGLEQFYVGIPEMQESGIDIASAWVDQERNVIHVDVTTSTDDALKAFRSRYTDLPFQVESSEPNIPGTACNNRNACPNPMRGGIRLDNTVSGTFCSSGFQAFDNQNNSGILTNRHCGDIGNVFNHNGQNFGFITTGDLTALIDAAFVRDTTTNFFVRDDVYHSNASSERDVSSVYTGSNTATGAIVCNVGVRTGGPECRNTIDGQAVVTVVYGPPFGTRTLRDQLRVFGCFRGGDSGGSTYTNSSTTVRARAIAHSGTFVDEPDCSDGGVFNASYLGHIQNHLGLTVAS